jgi:hypothetical protein
MEGTESLSPEDLQHRQSLIDQMEAEGYEFCAESDLDGMEETIRIAAETNRSLKVVTDETIGPKSCLIFRKKEN